MEDIRQRSPPAVARKDGLLGVGRVPVSGFKLFKRADTDAAGEGLNLQFAGVLVNYDLPWNPMKVEQRSGRIDRLGQPRPVIRVLSFAYKDTVEQDVFFTVGNRIILFQGIVGRLQPILSRLPRRFEELALLDRDARETARQRFLADLEQQVRDADESGFDIEVTVEGSLDLPSLPEPALTLRDLDRAIQIARARPPEVDFRPPIPDRTGLACRVAVPSGLRPTPEYLSSHPTTSSCSRLAETRSARSVWMAPAEARVAGESHGWSSALARKRSSWWRRDPDRAQWGVSRNCWRRWMLSGNRASFPWGTGRA
jgi:hypothetical protein